MHHKSRLATKPGITGMWQVSGRSDITDFEEVVRLDTEYIENTILKMNCGEDKNGKNEIYEYRDMEHFGHVEEIGLQEFASMLSECKKTYVPEKYDYRLKCLHKIEDEEINPALFISDDTVMKIS